MKFLLVSAILVAVCTANLPQNDVQHLTDEIRQAEDNLKGMLSLENKEEGQMKEIGISIGGVPNVYGDKNGGSQTQTLVQQVADLNNVEQNMWSQTQTLVQQFAGSAKRMAEHASNEELQQQQNAKSALTEVSDAIQKLQQAPVSQKKDLGEGAGEASVERALAKLIQVQSTLTRGTATMHTKERLDRMATEAQAVQELATEQPQRSAATSMHEDMASAVSGDGISALKQASSGAISALKQLQPSLGESKGAIAELQQATTGTATGESQIQQETEDLSQLLKQEKIVYGAEEASKSEIGRLIKNLD
jgi:hypothetical protein